MKKILVILFVSAFCVCANALVLRSTVKLCAEDVELVLYGGGNMSWYDGSTGRYLRGTYSLDWQTHYIKLYEEDGSLAFTGKFTGNDDKMTNVWSVTLGGVVMRQCSR